MKPLKSRLANWVVNSVLKGFTYEEVFEKLTQEDKNKLALKAKDYLADDFMAKFDKMIENLALNKMGRGSVSQDEMMFAKMVLWYHETRRTKLKEIVNWEKKETQWEDKKW
jgi:hypothetical protein